MIENGDVARDKITGFEGVVVGTTKWLNGCTRMGVQPKGLGENGIPVEAQWFDVQQLELISKGEKNVPNPDELAKNKVRKGGPQKDPKY